MSQNRLPTIKNPLADIQDLSIKPVEVMQETNRTIDEDENILEPQEEVDSSDVFSKYKKKENIKLETKDVMENNTDLDIVEDLPRVGGRGKDKVKRKKRTLTPAQLEGLKRGRIKSMETRKKNKKIREGKRLAPVNEMPAPVKNEKLDYDTFSNYMDQYEEKRKKKHSTTREPHPNKIINARHRPIAPQSKPRPIPRQPKVAKWTGNIGSFAQHQKAGGNGRWNYGV